MLKVQVAKVLAVRGQAAKGMAEAEKDLDIMGITQDTQDTQDMAIGEDIVAGVQTGVGVMDGGLSMQSASWLDSVIIAGVQVGAGAGGTKCTTVVLT